MKGKKTPQSSAVFELKTYRSVVNPLAHFATLLNNNFGKKLFIGYLTISQGNATASWIVCRASAEQRKIITFFLTLIFKIFMVKSCFRNKTSGFSNSVLWFSILEALSWHMHEDSPKLQFKKYHKSTRNTRTEITFCFVNGILISKWLMHE